MKLYLIASDNPKPIPHKIMVKTLCQYDFHATFMKILGRTHILYGISMPTHVLVDHLVLCVKLKNCRWFFLFFWRSVRPIHLHNCPMGFVPRPIFFLDTIIIQNENDMAQNRLLHGVGAQGECISWFIHLSYPVRDTSPNMPKEHKVLGLILIVQDIKVIRRGT